MGFIALLWRPGINIWGLVGQRMMPFWWNGEEDLVFWAWEGNTVILLCSGCAEKKEWWHFLMIRTNMFLVIRVKAGIRKKGGRASIKTNKNTRHGGAFLSTMSRTDSPREWESQRGGSEHLVLVSVGYSGFFAHSDAFIGSSQVDRHILIIETLWTMISFERLFCH